MMTNRAFLAGGSLMSYGPDVSKGFRRAARQLARAANGTPVADLPVEQPTHFEFVIDTAPRAGWASICRCQS